MTDTEIFPPPGYYRLDEAYQQWFGKLIPHRKPLPEEIDNSREQCVNWLASHRDAVKVFTRDGKTFEVPASAWDRKWFPDMLVLHQSIPFSPSSPFAEYAGAILIVRRNDFDGWIELTRHHDVIEKPIDLMSERRWGILPVLAWIATRDIGIAASATAPGSTIRGESIGLSIRKEMAEKKGVTISWPCDDLDDAWKLHLAEAMTKGSISCIADRVSQSKLGGISETVSGVIFPPQDAPAASLTHVVDDDNGTPTLVPSMKVLAPTWRAWNNPLFDRDMVLQLWPRLNNQSPLLSEIVLGIEEDTTPSVIDRPDLDLPTDGDISNFFLKTISRWSNDKKPPNKDEWFALHRKEFKGRALSSKEFQVIRARGGDAAVLPLYLRKSGNRQAGWRKNIPTEWQKRYGWQ